MKSKGWSGADSSCESQEGENRHMNMKDVSHESQEEQICHVNIMYVWKICHVKLKRQILHLCPIHRQIKRKVAMNVWIGSVV